MSFLANFAQAAEKLRQEAKIKAWRDQVSGFSQANAPALLFFFVPPEKNPLYLRLRTCVLQH
jgi:hypothetical protein